MASFLRYRPLLQGWVGGPGINTWHGTPDVLPILDSSAQQFATEIRAVYDALKSLLAPDVFVSFPSEMTEHDESTGQLMKVWAVTPPTNTGSTASSATGQQSRDVQALVRLQTNDTRDGRRLAGRHFIGPINTSALDSTGTLSGGARATIASAYGGILDTVGPNLYVWGPPKRNAAGAITAPGKLGRVISVGVAGTPGTLRSRKT